MDKSLNRESFFLLFIYLRGGRLVEKVWERWARQAVGRFSKLGHGALG